MQDGLTLGPGEIMLKAIKKVLWKSRTLARMHTKITKNVIVSGGY